ncbi:hypothetical protein ES288_D10G314200v1 [Gossypium darwinii]|uniref:Uncharacterized protein n=2 Tax=Gossypium TaxID=3633 RepID=A0A5D2JAU7_GOSTO|nr:hypothetical protein ES288_D10G314200v1 [Gossypium darwinii]TYH52037.1 hypothetical protein ES332_D10G322700v1 [Gossypium tomentosum]
MNIILSLTKIRVFSPHGYINNHTKLPIHPIYRDTMGLPKTSNQNPFKIYSILRLMQAPSSMKKKTYMHTRIMTMYTIYDHETQIDKNLCN